MALVYFDSRWKHKTENTVPGPGDYEPSESRPKTKVSQQRSRANMKKTSPISSFMKEQRAPLVKDWVNCQKQSNGRSQSAQFKKDGSKKGKLYRKNTNLKQRQSIQEQQMKEFQVKNNRSQVIISSKNKWDNTKIVQSMKEQKQKLSKKNRSQPSAASTKSFIAYQQQQKQKQNDELKDIQILYSSYRNKEESSSNIKNFNRQISSKHKQRQNKSHNYLNSINTFSGPFKDSIDLAVQPSAVYKSLPDQIEDMAKTGSMEIPPFKINTAKNSKDDSAPTAVDSDLMEDSVQYIQDATPGPGEYNLSTKSIARYTKPSKVEKFGVTIARFQPRKDSTPKSSLEPIYPEFKTSSKAKQEQVGFGRTTKHEKQQQKLHSGIFYEDPCSVQNMSKKTILKSMYRPFNFGTGQQRFSYIKKNKSPTSGENVPVIQQKYEAEQAIPSSVFLSKVERELPISTVTQNVDFSGQNQGCLAYKLIKQKQFYDDYQIKPVPFSSNLQRFDYCQPKQEGNKQELKLIRMKELKQKKQQKDKKPEKGYSFTRQKRVEQQERSVPSPDIYGQDCQWIKRSYNLRFS